MSDNERLALEQAMKDLNEYIENVKAGQVPVPKWNADRFNKCKTSSDMLAYVLHEMEKETEEVHKKIEEEALQPGDKFSMGSMKFRVRGEKK